MRESGFGGVLSSKPLCPDWVGERPNVARRVHELRPDETSVSRDIERRIPRGRVDREARERSAVPEQLQRRARAVANLDREPTGAPWVWVKVDLRAERRLRHERAALA